MKWACCFQSFTRIVGSVILIGLNSTPGAYFSFWGTETFDKDLTPLCSKLIRNKFLHSLEGLASVNISLCLLVT